MQILMEAHIGYKDIRSDKEYHLELKQEGVRYRVECRFGPRGGTLTHVDKTRGLVLYSKAFEVYNKTLQEKLNKGYKPLQSDQQKIIDRIQRETGILSFYLRAEQWKNLAEFVVQYAEECA